METMPLVDIIVPAAGGADYIRETLESVLAQSHRDFRLVVCDNACAHSRYREIVESFGDPRFQYVRYDERWPIQLSWQRCINEVRTELFVLLHDDDVWEPSFLREAVELCEDGVGLVLVPYQRFRQDGDRRVDSEMWSGWSRLRMASEIDARIILALTPVVHVSSALFRRMPIGFDPLYSWSLDQYYAQAYARVSRIAVAANRLAWIRGHQQSSTSTFHFATASLETIDLLKRSLVSILQKVPLASSGILEELYRLDPGASFRVMQAAYKWGPIPELAALRAAMARDRRFREKIGAYGMAGKIAKFLPSFAWFALSAVIEGIYSYQLSRRSR